MSPHAIKIFWGVHKWKQSAFRRALQSGVDAGELVQIRASYKLSPLFKHRKRDLMRWKKRLITKISLTKNKQKARVAKSAGIRRQPPIRNDGGI